MSEDLPHAPPEDFDDEDLTAAEYVLGVLDGPQRAAAEARADQEPAFAREILAWVVRLTPWIEAIPSVTPSAHLWIRIETAIERATKAHASPPPTPLAANDAPPRGLLLWKIWAMSATAVAAAALLTIGLRPGLPGVNSTHRPSILAEVGGGSDHTLVATLGLTAGGASAVTVAYDPIHSTIYASPDADFSVPKSRSAELWLIPSDGKPRPMGVIDATKPATMPMPEKFRTLARAKVTLALSIEPDGGSPTGQPTGPVVAAGKFAQL